jgi:hypothetical protein
LQHRRGISEHERLFVVARRPLVGDDDDVEVGRNGGERYGRAQHERRVAHEHAAEGSEIGEREQALDQRRPAGEARVERTNLVDERLDLVGTRRSFDDDQVGERQRRGTVGHREATRISKRAFTARVGERNRRHRLTPHEVVEQVVARNGRRAVAVVELFVVRH